MFRSYLIMFIPHVSLCWIASPFRTIYHYVGILVYKVAGLNGLSGACVMKMESSIAVVTVKSTVLGLCNVPGTAHSTKIACTMRSLVSTSCHYK